MIISFKHLTRKSNSDFTVTVERTGKPSVDVFFETPKMVTFGNDLIAHALSTLAARNFAAVHFDFPVSAAALSRIATFTLVRPTSTSQGDEETWERDENQVTLSFSGGFDSLAALALMPPSTALVSMDYGGDFERERSAFESFDPIIVKTNITETDLRHGSWSFMGIGAILTAKFTRSRYLTFGGILDQSPQAFFKPSPLIKNHTFEAFSACGYKYAPYVIGITEAGTAKIIAQAYPEKAATSLISLAPPDSEKLARKYLLLKYFAETYCPDLELPEISMSTKNQYKFGQAMVPDVMSFWFTKFYGADMAERMVKDLPDTVATIAKEHDLHFYERYKQDLYENFPKVLRGGLESSLSKFGFRPYDETDFEDFETVANQVATVRPLKGRS